MICSNCQTVNDNSNVFCVSCGATVTPTGTDSGRINYPSSSEVPLPKTQQFKATSDSVETSVLPVNQFNQSMPNYNPAMPNSGNYPPVIKQRNWLLLIGLPFLIFLAIGGGTFYLIAKQGGSSETLPEHFGFFSQNIDKNQLSELTKLDVTNALETKEKLLEDNDLPELKSNPSWILHAENNDISLSDLKLVEIDSIKDDGSFMQVEFQIAPVEGKPEMKKIRISKELATGKYAFAIFDGHLDEGKHRFWAFQVKSGNKSENGDLAKSTSLSLKPKENQEDKKVGIPSAPEVPGPDGSSVAYITQVSVIMRAGPSQSSAKLGNFRRGQKVFVLEYSDNKESFKNYYTNFARVQTTDGRTGWVYSAFLRYQ